MTEHLKPCPFCGNDGSGPIEDALQICEVDMEGQWKAPMAYSVQCDKCTATMGYSESIAEAVEAWNTRAAMQPTPQEAAKVLLAMGPTDRHKAWKATKDAPGMFGTWLHAALRAIASEDSQ